MSQAPAPKPADAPKPAEGPEPADTAQLPTATADADVDVYDVPGGDGNIIGMLRAGQTVQTRGTCSKDDRCEVPGTGWVWGGLLKY